MFTATADLILPSTTTGSFPRPRWFDVSMWGRPLDTCMLEVRFREKFQDALAVVIGDQERAGLDIVTHGDFHLDEDFAGRAWHHYPLQRWAGFEGDYLQPEATTAPWLHYPPGTLLNEIYTGWRWPHVVNKIEHRALDYPKLWRMAQGKTGKTVKFGTCLIPTPEVVISRRGLFVSIGLSGLFGEKAIGVLSPDLTRSNCAL
jgi:5-methyltetrahydropteroyltriglutamate--homocysteine methyltransferase